MNKRRKLLGDQRNEISASTRVEIIERSRGRGRRGSLTLDRLRRRAIENWIDRRDCLLIHSTALSLNCVDFSRGSLTFFSSLTSRDNLEQIFIRSPYGIIIIEPIVIVHCNGDRAHTKRHFFQFYIVFNTPRPINFSIGRHRGMSAKGECSAT